MEVECVLRQRPPQVYEARDGGERAGNLEFPAGFQRVTIHTGEQLGARVPDLQRVWGSARGCL